MIRIWQGLACVLSVPFFAMGASQAEEHPADLPANPGFALVKEKGQRHTLKELRDQHVVKQQLDYSCGAAALATLLSNYYGEQTSESEIRDLLNMRFSKLTKEDIARKTRNGYSLLDLKFAAEQLGYQAAGFKLTADQLRQLAAPVIVYVRPLGYHHFAVLRGIAADRVFLADPGRGNLSMSIARFLSEYGGVVFVLGKPGEETITNYPLALSRPKDYVRPDPARVFNTLARSAALTVDLTVRTRPR